MASKHAVVAAADVSDVTRAVSAEAALPSPGPGGDDHEYEISADGKKVVEVSKTWFRLRDTYGVEVAPGNDEILILAITVAIDSISH